ncbi:hypothetical protein KKH18_02905, partial [bacterium]|nr:hypothetical protein [bacterium]
MKQLLQNMNRLVCLLLFLSIAGSFCYGETFVMDSAVQPGAALRVLSESSSEVTLEFTFGVMEIDSLDSGGRFWKTASIEGCGLSSESGEPELPQYAAWIRVPWLNPQIDVVETDMQERSWGRVLPSPEPMMRGISESIRRIPKPSVYERNRYYPSQAAACDVAGQISRSGVALVTITPVQVNSRTGNWRIHSRIQIRLSGTRRGNLDDLYSETYSTRMLLNTVTRNPAG